MKSTYWMSVNLQAILVQGLKLWSIEEQQESMYPREKYIYPFNHSLSLFSPIPFSFLPSPHHFLCFSLFLSYYNVSYNQGCPCTRYEGEEDFECLKMVLPLPPMSQDFNHCATMFFLCFMQCSALKPRFYISQAGTLEWSYLSSPVKQLSFSFTSAHSGI